MIKKIHLKTETFLYKKQFFSPTIRKILATQILISAFTFISGLLLLPLNSWVLLFSCGSIIVSFNFWHISRFAASHSFKIFSPLLGIKYFVLFLLRLFATGLALYSLLILLRAPLVPLLVGLATVVLVILAWGLSQTSKAQAEEV